MGKIQILTTTKILETSGSGTEQIVQGTGVKRVAPTAVQYWARISTVTISTMDDSRERPGSLGLASSTRRRRANNEMNAHRMLRAITAANSCGHSGGRYVKRYSRPSNSCASCKPAHIGRFHYAHRPKRLSMRRVRSRTARPRAFAVWIKTKACLSRPNAFHSRRTKPPSSQNCKQHRMSKLCRHGHWN